MPPRPVDSTPMREPLRVGVVGAGVFGGYHAGKVAGHPRAVLSGVSDPDLVRARAMGLRHGVGGMTLDTLLAESDAVVVASPATTHGEVAVRALEAGLHVLVEKPLAHTVAWGERVVDAAQGRVLQVGHQERLVAEAAGLRNLQGITGVEAWRESPASNRGRDVGVALDLMIHDIDLAHWLLGGAAEDVAGESNGNVAEAVFTIGGVPVHLRSSRVAEVSRRMMRIHHAGGVAEVDWNSKTVSGAVDGLDPDFGARDMARDSLGAATDRFVRAVLDGDPPLASGEDGLRALRVAAKVEG